MSFTETTEYDDRVSVPRAEMAPVDEVNAHLEALIARTEKAMHVAAEELERAHAHVGMLRDQNARLRAAHRALAQADEPTPEVDHDPVDWSRG